MFSKLFWRHGEKVRMWLKQLTIAIVERNIDKVNELMDNLPQLEKKEDLDQAVCLLKEATTLVQGFKDDTQVSMIQMKKNIKFLEATQLKAPRRLDIKL